MSGAGAVPAWAGTAAWRLLVLPPRASDGPVTARVLGQLDAEVGVCASLEELCRELGRGAAALVIAEEWLVEPDLSGFARLLDQQPEWSDLPLIVLTSRQHEAPMHWGRIAELDAVRNATLLERPMHTDTLLQAVRVALRARARQYELRAHLAERDGLLAQRETLLRELQHRVKNNLQMVHSLVRMASQRAPSSAKGLLAEVGGRIWAIGKLHEQIYAGKDLTEIELSSYLGSIADEVMASFGKAGGEVRLIRRLEPMSVDVKLAMPIGLIVNELLTNALKHAFPAGRAGSIRLELASGPAGLRLVVADDGVGLPAEPGRSSTGLRLVRALAKQVGGSLEIKADRGTCASLHCPPRQQGQCAA